MSLATSSGGMGAGAGGGMAMAMAHQPHAMTQHAQGPQGPTSGPRTTSAPRSASGLAADVVDKNISAKQIRNSRNLPIVCMDLYGDGEIAYVAGEGMAKEKSGNWITMGTVGTSRADLYLKRNDESAYRALRKLLSKGEKGGGFYNRALSACVSTDASKEDVADVEKIVSIRRPVLLLGARSISQLHSHTVSQYPHSSEDLKPILVKSMDPASSAIHQYDETSSKTGVAIRNQSLDGSSPSGIDFDRVSLQLDLLPKKKKPLTILPDETVALLLAKARKLVQTDIQIRFPDSVVAKDVINASPQGKNSKKKSIEEDDDDSEQYLNYPMAIAVAGWHIMDATVEAHLESILGSGSEGMVYHRPVAALAGALFRRGGESTKTEHKLISCIHGKFKAIANDLAEKEKQARINKTQLSAKDLSLLYQNPLVITLGITSDGIEGFACIVSKSQKSEQAPIGNIKALTEVSFQHNDPLTHTQYVMEQIMEGYVHKILPTSNHVPCAIVTFGQSSLQEKLKSSIRKVLKTKEKDWGMISGGGSSVENVPILSTKEEAIAMGACVLAAGAHGRIMAADGQKVTITVENSSTCALGVKFTYFENDNKEEEDDEDVKVLFDFDRRVPAAPYALELTAAECAAIRSRGDKKSIPIGHLEEEEVKKFTGSRKIKVREEAALSFKMQIVQKCERDGKWTKVGDVLEPLQLKEDEETNPIAIESCILEISLGVSGLVTTQSYSDRKSVAEATKSERVSKIQYYFIIIFVILFCGGFLVKSYVEDKVFHRDVKILLKYYKHVLPNSINDGNVNNARYLVYKYRNKKHRLWKTLENKYGIAVSEDYSNLDEDEEEVEELDDEDDETKEEPDL